MANKKIMRHASAMKALRQSHRLQKHNRDVKSEIRTAAQHVLSAVAAKDIPLAKKRLVEAASLWSRAAHRHMIHSNAASRKISRLSKLVHALSGR